MKLPRQKQKIGTGNKGKRLEKRFGASLTQLALLLTRITAAFSYFFFCFIKFGKHTPIRTEREKLGLSASLGLLLFAGDVIGFLFIGKVTLTPGSDE